MTDSTFEERKRQVLKGVAGLPHCKMLGITGVKAGKGTLTLKLPYRTEIIGNPTLGLVHGGALTTLMDTACGFAVILAQDEFQICPTLDLRMDYMRAPEPGKPIFADAVVYRETKNVVFTRGVAYHEGQEDQPIAHCVATFMRLNAEVSQSVLQEVKQS